MSETQLSIRSTRAHKIAKRLAKLERRTVRQIVERALDTYAKTVVPERKNEAAEGFFARMRRENTLDQGEDIDLYAVIESNRVPHKPVEF